MIETSLIKLDEAVQNGQTLSAGSKVILQIGEEAEIYGFIAIEDISLDDNFLDIDIDMPPLGECHVLSNRVFFYLDKQIHRFPIFCSVSKATEEKYRLYLLYVPKFFHSSTERVRGIYRTFLCQEKPNQKYIKLNRVGREGNIAYYYTNEHDLFFESRSNLRGIGSGFAVVTRRISMPSENIKYEIFDSHSVMIERT